MIAATTGYLLAKLTSIPAFRVKSSRIIATKGRPGDAGNFPPTTLSPLSNARARVTSTTHQLSTPPRITLHTAEHANDAKTPTFLLRKRAPVGSPATLKRFLMTSNSFDSCCEFRKSWVLVHQNRSLECGEMGTPARCGQPPPAIFETPRPPHGPLAETRTLRDHPSTLAPFETRPHGHGSLHQVPIPIS